MAVERLALSPSEAALALGLHPQTVRALIGRGELAAVHVGRRLVIPRSAIDKFLAGEPAAEGARR